MAVGIQSKLLEKHLFFDGAMGTALQRKGLKLGEIPEIYNFTHSQLIQSIHADYLEAGADVLTTNTFGCNRYKISDTTYTVEEVIKQATRLAQEVIEGRPDKYVALDIGSTGKLLEPMGDIPFEEAYEVFKEQAVAGEKAGVDVVLLETFTDLYELKAAVLAVKENTNLPVFCTMSFESNGFTFFGTRLECMILTLEALGVDALGVNCSLGPKELKPIIKKLSELVSIPIMVQPNAGLPVIVEGETKYNITAAEFAAYMGEFAGMGVAVLGGCCGTDATYIKQMREKIEHLNPTLEVPRRIVKRLEGVCSSSQYVDFQEVKMIGERLNPTGKKLLQEALRTGNMEYILKEAINQENKGADILDVNVGLPDIDEVVLLAKVVKEVQGVVDLPLQIDSSNPHALAAAVRIYNGKPLINSVNGKEESLKAVLPIAKQYGACILGLTLDETGIPKMAEERLLVAKKIMDRAVVLGIPKEDLFIDTLVLTASAEQTLVKETLKAVRLVKEDLGLKTVLGVSNVSFGLPNRPLLNQTMLAMAIMEGLDAPILNPFDEGMVGAVAASKVLMGKDKNAEYFIQQFGQMPTSSKVDTSTKAETNRTLKDIIRQGIKEEAKEATKKLLEQKVPLEIVKEEIMPALDEVGKSYEKGELFLPSLIQAAETAKRVFEELKAVITKEDHETELNTTPIVLATVHGDIHDIGKNIVKVIMENYGFLILDLGKDVPVQKVVDTVREKKVTLVGLSALMTTTVKSMEATIKALREACPWCKVMVGGAVLTEELAAHIGADYYAKDAMDGVKIAQQIHNNTIE